MLTPDDETRFMAPIQAAARPPRYEMLGELGRGGMGIVYKVRDRETGEVQTLKILKPEIAANPQILEAAKRGVVGNFAPNLEQPSQVLTQSYLRHRYGFSKDY